MFSITLQACSTYLRNGISKWIAPASQSLTSTLRANGMLGFRNFSVMSTPRSALQSSSFPSMACSHSCAPVPSNTIGGVIFTQIRTKKMRNNWPRPKETKRLQMGWEARMKTPGGRRVIMRRILKGRHVLTH